MANLSSTWAQDFKTGYYTLASPKALFFAQLVGAFVGVLFAPAVYAFYTHSFDVGVDYDYSVPCASSLLFALAVSPLQHFALDRPLCAQLGTLYALL